MGYIQLTTSSGIQYIVTLEGSIHKIILHTVMLMNITSAKVQESEKLLYINNIIQFVELFASFRVNLFIYHYHTMHICVVERKSTNQISKVMCH